MQKKTKLKIAHHYQLTPSVIVYLRACTVISHIEYQRNISNLFRGLIGVRRHRSHKRCKTLKFALNWMLYRRGGPMSRPSVHTEHPTDEQFYRLLRILQWRKTAIEHPRHAHCDLLVLNSSNFWLDQSSERIHRSILPREEKTRIF